MKKLKQLMVKNKFFEYIIYFAFNLVNFLLYMFFQYNKIKLYVVI